MDQKINQNAYVTVSHYYLNGNSGHGNDRHERLEAPKHRLTVVVSPEFAFEKNKFVKVADDEGGKDVSGKRRHSHDFLRHNRCQARDIEPSEGKKEVDVGFPDAVTPA